MKLHYSTNPEIAIFNDLSNLIISRRSISITLFLCGGSAVKIYEYFANKFESFLSLAESVGVSDFSNLTISLTDDRWFEDLSNPNINSTVIKNTDLISKFENLGAKFIPMTNSDNIVDDVNNFNMNIKDSFDNSFKILIGGIGKDGHTCGIIPQVNEEEYLKKYGVSNYAVNVKVENIHPDRITLTPYSLIKMDECLIYMVGEDKKDILNKLLYGNEVNEINEEELSEENKISSYTMPSIIYKSVKSASIYTDITL